MNEIVVLNPVLTMTSREIAELTGKRHDNVVADIVAMVLELDVLKSQGISPTDYTKGTYTDVGGRQQVEYTLEKTLTLTLLTGYSVAARHSVVKRWQALETLVVEQAQQLLATTQATLAIAHKETDKYQRKLEAVDLEQASRQYQLDSAVIVKNSQFHKLIKEQTDSDKRRDQYTALLLSEIGELKFAAAEAKDEIVDLKAELNYQKAMSKLGKVGL